MRLVTSTDWFGGRVPPGEHTQRMVILDQDITSAQLAIADYNSVEVGSGRIDVVAARRIHYAKTFVLAMRRVGRVVQSIVAGRDDLPTLVSDKIQLAWRKKKAMFDQYIEPRNVIEHIDGEVSQEPIWIVMNLRNDALEVTQEKKAMISLINLQKAVELRNELIDAYSVLDESQSNGNS